MIGPAALSQDMPPRTRGYSFGMMSISQDHAQTTTKSARRPLWLLHAGALVIVLLLAGADVAVLLNLRESALRNAEGTISTVALTLSEQCERTLQSVDLLLTSVAETVTAEGIDDADGLRQKMVDRGVYLMLRDKLAGLPFLDALSIVGADGKVVNFSRFWPTPAIDVSDRDYFKALRDDPRLTSFISAPVQNRGTGTWTVYLARKIQGRDGRFMGVLLGALELRYFQDLYRAVSLAPGSAITLWRDDGVMLARYPDRQVIGQRFDLGGWRAARDAPSGVLREAGVSDSRMRIKAAHRLSGFPLVVLVTQIEEMVLRDWWHMVWLVGVVTGGCALSIVLAAAMLTHWLRQQDALVGARTERTELEKARAVAEASLARARERAADDANNAKSRFLAMMSHEIRTPMNAVLGLAGALLNGSLSTPHRRIVETIRDSGNGLLRILNDILDFSKLEAGRMTFEARPFSPAAITEDVADIFRTPALAKGLDFHVIIDPGVPAAAEGDPGRIRQVLSNIVSNAVKFTTSGAIDIRLACVRTGDQTTTLEWQVEDSGIGIAPDRIARLFTEFAQADESITRRFGGSGLGLAISKRLIDQMGGMIGVSSTEGSGTKFSIRLSLPLGTVVPEPAPTATDAAQALNAAIDAIGRPVRVLFVEDNPVNQFVGMELLRGFDLRIDLASDGLEALRAVSDDRYDVIFMDMRMPEMDGLTATRRMRTMGGWLARVPIIALTANAFPDDMKACRDAGMSRFLAKPVSRTAILTALVDSLAGRAAALESGGIRAAVHASLDTEAFAMLREVLGNDRLAGLCAMFEEETRERLRRLPSLTATPSEAVVELHALKGAADSVGAASLASVARDLEPHVRQGGVVGPAELSRLTEAFEGWMEARRAGVPA